MALKLKKEYEGVTVGRQHYLIGMVTFDANKTTPEHYPNYVKLGFDFLFEEEPEPESEPVKSYHYEGVKHDEKPKRKYTRKFKDGQHEG